MNRLSSVFSVLFAMTVFSATASPAPITAEQIYLQTGVRGGLVVHLGCDDPELTAALRPNDRYLVHGLDTDAARIANTRRLLRAKGLYGPVSVDTFDGKNLPYVENTVSLLVCGKLGNVPMSEVLRVLAPEGVAYIRRGNSWQKTIKPRPQNVDEWSHFLHDAGGNAVANDEQVGPPKKLRWVAEPRWCRSHEIPSSVQAVVTAGGRIFTIFDEAPTGVYEKLPQRSLLIARNAYNGVLLWKVPMKKWQSEYGTGKGNRWNIHHTIPRRLVTDGEKVYVTLQFVNSPVSVLDAATGEILTEAIDGTTGADEMLLCEGVLIVKTTARRSVGATVRLKKDMLNDTLVGIDAQTGKQLWRKQGVRVLPYALSAAAGRLVYHNMDELVCLDAATGSEIWRTPNIIASTVGAASTLIVNEDVVLFHGHGRMSQASGKPKIGLYLTALSAENGRILWRRKGTKGQAGACTQPTDMFVVDGRVWLGGWTDGYDIRTGKVTQRVSLQKLISPGHHYRCHRSKATERYLIWPKRGAEFIDLQQGEHMRNDWLRAPCFTGATPANGLFYAPPSPCFCYPGVKVSGYLAMAADEPEELTPSTDKNLTRGDAYGKVPQQAEISAADWPMYRRDFERSGSTGAGLSPNPQKLWEKTLTCRGTQAVVVGDRLWLAERDAHRIRCIKASDSADLWTFTAGGRIDSSPTIYKGMVLFGCRDGSVYCLRATDGELVWRFDAAPRDRRIVSFGQLESLWPVQGSVLVRNGVVYFAAGRSSFLDGGILVYGLDAATGRPLYNHHLKGPWPDISKDVGRPFAMEGALPDLLVSDGKYLYMGRIKFDTKLNRLETTRESDLGELDMGARHLVPTGGFLDDTGFDRLYWMYSDRWPGFYFAQHAPKSGQLLVFDDSTTYAVKYFYRRIVWSPALMPDDKGYLLFADDNDNEPVLQEKGKTIRTVQWLPDESYSDKHRRGGRGVEKGTGYVRSEPPKWKNMIPVRVRAMVLTGDILFVAGVPDVIDPDDPLAAFEGRAGAVLQAYSTADGSRLWSRKLSSVPAFDGLSAASQRLYLVTLDGKLICFSNSRADKQLTSKPSVSNPSPARWRVSFRAE